MVADTQTDMRLLGESEACARLDAASRYFLRISGEEFLKRWRSGYYASPDQVPGVMEVASLLG